MTLAALAAMYGGDASSEEDRHLKGFRIFGVVKETNVDDEGLVDFGSRYFPFPLYCDQSYSLYQFLGSHKAFEIPSLWTLLTTFLDAWKRISSKGISWNLKGEGLIKGGLIIFDRKGIPKYAYKETMGEDLPVQEIVLAVQAMRRETLDAGHNKVLAAQQ